MQSHPWIKVDLDWDSVDAKIPLTFVDCTRAEFVHGAEAHRGQPDTTRTHADLGTRMSMCYQFVLFLNPHLDQAPAGDVHSLYPTIELWFHDDSLWMFRSPPCKASG